MSEPKEKPQDFRSPALRKNWDRIVPLLEEINKIDEKIANAYDGDEYDFRDWYEEKYPDLRANRLQLLQRFEAEVAQHEKPECMKLGDAVSERLAPELREMIYESICVSSDHILIPKRHHAFFSKIPDAMEGLGRWDGEEMNDEDEEVEDELLDLELLTTRTQPWFRPDWVGLPFASEITKSYFEKNHFQFRDVRRCMVPFLTTRFPCGTTPANVIRQLRIYVRCESFLEWAGWDSTIDPEEGTGEEPDSDFEWKEHGVYNRIVKDVRCLTRIPFQARPNITLVIITPFDRYGAGHVDCDRVLLNFEEAMMEAYHGLRGTSTIVDIVIKGFELATSLEGDLPAELSDKSIKWQFDLPEVNFLERKRRGQYPRYSYPKEANPPHRARLVQQIEALNSQKMVEAKAERKRRVDAWKASVPESRWGRLNFLPMG